MPQRELRCYTFKPIQADLDAGRAIACLAFAIRARNDLPETAFWALKTIGLEVLPRDLRAAARLARKPRYDVARQMVKIVPEHELIKPLVTGMRLIMDPTKETASIAEHNRIRMALEYVAPIIERNMPERLADYNKLCQFYLIT